MRATLRFTILLTGALFGLATSTPASVELATVTQPALQVAAPAVPVEAAVPTVVDWPAATTLATTLALPVEPVAPATPEAPAVPVEPTPVVEQPLIVPCAVGYVNHDGRLQWHADPDGGYRAVTGETMGYGGEDGCGAEYVRCYDFSQPPPHEYTRDELVQCPWPEDFTKIPPPVVP